MADSQFPCSLHLQFPFPSARLASTALQSIQVDPELSSLVKRELTTSESTLLVHYQATTNRMLRVAVNSFMDSLKLVVEVMEKLDVDVLAQSTADAAKANITSS
ncbi:hypothetical protein Golomagni_07736 [Golovinomyces magnicellulatus]|nr:hypothetical protein Golomagni_07736 [Golovinomyces magnicellulatus]